MVALTPVSHLTQTLLPLVPVRLKYEQLSWHVHVPYATICHLNFLILKRHGLALLILPSRGMTRRPRMSVSSNPFPPASHRDPLFHDSEVRRIRNHSTLEFIPLAQRYLNLIASRLEARAARLELAFEDAPMPGWEGRRLGRSK